MELTKSPYLHRERTFLGNPRTPNFTAHTTRVRPCTRAAQAATASGCGAAAAAAAAAAGEVLVGEGSSLSDLQLQLGKLSARVLHLSDIDQLVSSFGRSATGAVQLDAVAFHEG